MRPLAPQRKQVQQGVAVSAVACEPGTATIGPIHPPACLLLLSKIAGVARLMLLRSIMIAQYAVRGATFFATPLTCKKQIHPPPLTHHCCERRAQPVIKQNDMAWYSSVFTFMHMQQSSASSFFGVFRRLFCVCFSRAGHICAGER